MNPWPTGRVKHVSCMLSCGAHVDIMCSNPVKTFPETTPVSFPHDTFSPLCVYPIKRVTLFGPEYFMYDILKWRSNCVGCEIALLWVVFLYLHMLAAKNSRWHGLLPAHVFFVDAWQMTGVIVAHMWQPHFAWIWWVVSPCLWALRLMMIYRAHRAHGLGHASVSIIYIHSLFRSALLA